MNYKQAGKTRSFYAGWRYAETGTEWPARQAKRTVEKPRGNLQFMRGFFSCVYHHGLTPLIAPRVVRLMCLPKHCTPQHAVELAAADLATTEEAIRLEEGRL